MSINLANLISICLQLAQEGCKIVKDSFMNKEVKKFQKGINDPVTQADFKIQTMIIKGLTKCFPSLKIVGEQTTQYQGKIQFNFESLSQQFLPKNMQLNREDQLKDLCVWIDPIDCTRGFINGQIQFVTILIGITWKKRPIAGIIGMPYKLINQEALYRPSVMFGSVKDKIAAEYYFDEKKQKGDWIVIERQKPEAENRRIVVSDIRPKSWENKIGKQLKGDIIRSGGAGRKIVMVIKQEVEMMMYIKSATQKWDSCAGEAIVLALGGYFLTPFGQQLVYKQENDANTDGFICTFDESLFQETIKICTETCK